MMLKHLAVVASCALLATAHMQLNYPPPFRAFNNPHTVGAPDDELLYPYNCCGNTNPDPCRGYLNLLGTPQGASVANWAAGSQQNWSMVGPAPLGGNHYGGSCQIGFSTDSGKTFRTAVSYEGNCAHRNGGETAAGQQFPFTVPSDLPNGDVIFAWTWNNREQEFFMNCAVVTINGGSGTASALGSSGTSPASSLATGAAAAASVQTATPASSSGSMNIPYQNAAGVSDDSDSSAAAATPSPVVDAAAAVSSSGAESGHKGHKGRKCHKHKSNQKRSHPLLDASQKFKRLPGRKAQRFVRRAAMIPFEQRPYMLFSDINNGCETVKTTAELKYPDPGPDIVEGDGDYPLALPTGNCVMTGAF